MAPTGNAGGHGLGRGFGWGGPRSVRLHNPSGESGVALARQAAVRLVFVPSDGFFCLLVCF